MRDQSLCEARKLGEAELVLINSHATLDKSLELPKLPLPDMSWNELPEEVHLEGCPSDLISDQS